MQSRDPSQLGAIALAKLENLLQHPGFRMDDHMKFWVNPQYLFPNPDQPRKVFDVAALARHKESIMEAGQIEPVVIIPFLTESNGQYIGKIVDGERTWRVCKELNQWVYVVFTDPPKDDNELFERALIANFDQQKHTINETIDAVARLRDVHGRSFEEIRAQLALGSLTDVHNYYKLRLLHQELRPLLDVSTVDAREKQMVRMAKIVGLKLADFPTDKQKGLWFEVMTLGAIHAVRQLDSHRSQTEVAPQQGSRSRNRSPADLLTQLEALINRANADTHQICVGIPPEKLSVIVQKMREARTMTGTLKQIEQIYLTAAYLYLTLATMEIEQVQGSQKANKARQAIRERLNLGDWEPASVAKAREAARGETK